MSTRQTYRQQIIRKIAALIHIEAIYVKYQTKIRKKIIFQEYPESKLVSGLGGTPLKWEIPFSDSNLMYCRLYAKKGKRSERILNEVHKLREQLAELDRGLI